MTYLLTGNMMYSSTTTRDAALAAVNAALVGKTYTAVTTLLPAGITTSGNAVRMSITIPDSDVGTTVPALRTAFFGQTRATTGHWITTVKID